MDCHHKIRFTPESAPRRSEPRKRNRCPPRLACWQVARTTGKLCHAYGFAGKSLPRLRRSGETEIPQTTISKNVGKRSKLKHPAAAKPPPEQGCSHEGRAQNTLCDRPIRHAGDCSRLQQMLLPAHVLLLSADSLLLRRLLLQADALHLLLVQVLLPRLLLQAATLHLLLLQILLPRLLL